MNVLDVIDRDQACRLFGLLCLESLTGLNENEASILRALEDLVESRVAIGDFHLQSELEFSAYGLQASQDVPPEESE